jgi:predicted metal-dependent peptidase
VIDEINRPDVDLDDVLRRFVGGEQPDDYSYRRPNKKLYHSARMIAPTMDRFGVGNILLAVDTSGSMSDKELTHCLGVINAISEEMSPSSIRVVCCDMTINSIRDYEAGEAIMDIKPNGRGGTLVKPVFDHVEDEQLDISQMIYLTDLEVWDYPDHAPEYPVMWVSTQAGITPPFGEVTVISVK